METKHKIDTVIFDLDGTLLDTLADLAASVNHALRQNRFPGRSVQEVRRFLGNGIRVLMQCSVPEGTPDAAFEKAFSDFRTYYLDHCLDTTRPYEGIMPLLARLAVGGYSLAIVSNKLQPAVTELCERFFGQYVHVAIGESRDVRRKPAPDTVQMALRRLGKTPATAVYVGDSEVDLLTARNAGLPCISVLWGFRDRDFLERRHARCLVSEPAEIWDVLQERNAQVQRTMGDR